MSTSPPPKDNEHIRADQQAFMATYERAREVFGRIDGVIGVAFGHKQTGGQYSGDVSIVVFVREKKPEDQIPPAERIPPMFEGYRTDVRTPISVVDIACENDAAYTTIQGGIQIQSDPDSLGTLGCIVRRRGDAGHDNVYLLSAKHVLFGPNAPAGTYVYHPYKPDPSRQGASLGPVQEAKYYANVTATVPDASSQPVSDTFYIDCGTARIDVDSKCCGSTCTRDVIAHSDTVVDLQVNGVNTIADVRSIARDPSIVVPSGPAGPTGPFVYKVGRTTGRTRGIVRLVNAPVQVHDSSDPTSVAFLGQNLIAIDFDTTSESTGVNCLGHALFAEAGDSGSLVVDDAGRAIGLLHGGQNPADPHPGTTCTACHILPVLDTLGICIPTSGGTSHGSCGATDGSGLTGATTADAGGDATVGFAGAVSTGLAFPAPIPISEAERERMLLLLDRFRATPCGPELHETFARVRREVGYLVRNSRPVKVAWHRNEGPAFMAHVLNHLRGETPAVPSQVNGVPRAQLLARMAEALAARGSIPLSEAIERNRAELLPILSEASTVDDAITRLAEARVAEPAPAGEVS